MSGGGSRPGGETLPQTGSGSRDVVATADDASGEDHTIVRSRARSGHDVSDATIVRAPEGEQLAADDATIVRPHEQPASDATVVRPREQPISDATIVRSHHQLLVDDETRVRSSDADADGDAVATPLAERAPAAQGAPPKRRRIVRDASTAPAGTASAAVAPPIEEPVEHRSWGGRRSQQMDPDRRIGPVPGTAPWDPVPTPERGVRPEIPVIYGPRSEHMPGHAGTDAIHQELGAPPAATPVAVRQNRAALPSLQARTKRSNVLTLATWGLVTIGAAVGLWAIAAIAFG